MAEAYPYPLLPVVPNMAFLMVSMMLFCSLLDRYTMVYTTFSSVMGLMVGSVIFQKHSQVEPPSIFAASYSEVSIF